MGDPVLPKEDSADLTLKEDEPLDFSNPKKKKKKKAVAVDLESVETPESAPTTTTTNKAGSGNVKRRGARGVLWPEKEEEEQEERVRSRGLREGAGCRRGWFRLCYTCRCGFRRGGRRCSWSGRRESLR